MARPLAQKLRSMELNTKRQQAQYWDNRGKRGNQLTPQLPKTKLLKSFDIEPKNVPKEHKSDIEPNS